MWFSRAITGRMLRLLTKPLRSYTILYPNDLDRLRRHVRPGDVLLVEGNNRSSAAIKYLTASMWSHAALYIGDTLCRIGHPAARTWGCEHGDEGCCLLIEALPDQGVIASPISKYVDFNLRVCRPFGITPEDVRLVLEEAVGHLGARYDMRNALDLARYFLPFQLIPARYRRTALHFGSGVPTEVICSSLIAEAFGKVRFPITPEVTYPAPVLEGFHLGRALLGTESAEYTGLFRMRHPTLVTPRDFDLSPYFAIVKFNILEEGTFDYRKIHWRDGSETRERR